MCSTFKYLLTVACVVFSVAATRAESLQMDEIAVKGAMESPHEESLTIREVRESAARDIGEALKQVEGISIVRKGAIANDVVLRGFQRDNINVLVDGVRLHGACPNRMDSPAFHYDFAEIEQIRIIKGPYDLENPGSMAGEINALTKKAGKGFGSDLSFTAGSYDSFNTSATASYGTDSYDFLGGYAFKYSGVPKSGDGKLITDIYSAASANRYRPDALDSKAYEIHTGWTKLGYNPTDHSRTELSYSYQDAAHILYPYLLMDADYDRTHRLNWTYRIEKISPLVRDLKLQAYWDRVSHLMDDRLRFSSSPSATVTRPYSMQSDATSQVVGAKLNGQFALGSGTAKGGVDYYNRTWDTVNVRAMYTSAVPYTLLNMIPDVAVDNFGMFIEHEMPLSEEFKVRGGVRGDLTWIKANKSNPLVTSANESTEFGEISANLQLTYTPVTGIELFAGLGRGTRPPDPQELYISIPAMAPRVTTKGNPGLDATINHQADLGVKYAVDKFYANASLFYSDLQNYITIKGDSTALVKSYSNVDATMWGAEFGSQFSLPFDLYLKASLSYTEGKNKSNNRPLPEIPPLKGYLALRYDVDTWFVEVAENLAARQDRVDSTLQEQETAGWLTTDLKGGAHYKSLSCYAGANNLFDKFYYSHLSYQRDPFSAGVKVPENGRNFYVTVAYKF